jgi:hypothetical protein
MIETKLKRRWSRFSLQSVFVLIGVASVPMGWAAYQLNWIRERHEFITNHSKHPHNPPPPVRLDAQFPWALQLFGEKPVSRLWVASSDGEMEEQLFPEASIAADKYQCDSASQSAICFGSPPSWRWPRAGG